MDKSPTHHAATGNVQGFELPRGCLMTSAGLLLPIVVVAGGAMQASTLHDLLWPAIVAAGFIAMLVAPQAMRAGMKRPRGTLR